ncbi:MAG: 5'/3'-nucleotidase SurE [Desulfobacterales bacterium]|nr:5'/3'-nucleotidase SurE [Desulfobacterales bacterium]
MNILLTNDDGIYAPGLAALYAHLAPDHHVAVIAPDREQSAVGHGITLNDPLRAQQVSIPDAFEGYAISGTPADCIKFGVLEILKTKPDLVISGINPGANVGVNINYSGTVAAAKEATLYGIMAIAVSIHSRQVESYDAAAVIVAQLVQDVYARGLPPGTFLNVNIPNLPLAKIAGVQFSRLDMDFFPEYIDKRIDPRQRTYYWQGCDSLPQGKSIDIDGSALCKNFISITPIKCDQTDYEMLEELQEGWKKITRILHEN